jgi:hypothetical protein
VEKEEVEEEGGIQLNKRRYWRQKPKNVREEVIAQFILQYIT